VNDRIKKWQPIKSCHLGLSTVHLEYLIAAFLLLGAYFKSWVITLIRSSFFKTHILCHPVLSGILADRLFLPWNFFRSWGNNALPRAITRKYTVCPV